ncbi:hypothetical protein FRC19_002096 [Serendipita sp. 401]|nr:hypothetical protein FRC19_002096 [Serendipita sp. 401]KAG9032791.1 hypothetical protein FS842_004033 [Serendipita sp. 407]
MNKYLLDLCDRLQGASDTESKLHFLDEISNACAVLKDIQLGDEINVVYEDDDNILGSTPVGISDRINNLPTELLLNILKLHLSSEHVRRDADLMLVCKKWKELVASTPSFWNRIEVTPHSSLRNVKKCTLMVMYCIRKSGSMPLDLTLDLHRLWNPRTEPQEDVGPYLFVKPWRGHDNDDVIQRISKTAVQSLLSYTLNLVCAFVKRNKDFEEKAADAQQYLGESRRDDTYVHHMSRWRSFRLLLSQWMDNDFIQPIFDELSDPAPNLKTLILSHESNNLHWMKGMNDRLYQHMFQGLQRLREFSVNAAIDLPQFQGVQNSLVSLSIVPNTSSLAGLLNYPNLHTLHLTLNHYRRIPPPIPGIPGTTFSLPYLSTLILFGNQSGQLLNLIDAPNLQCLRLSNPFVQSYPVSSLFRLVRSLEWDIVFKERSAFRICQSLSEVLRQCDRLTELVARAGSWKQSSDPIRQMIPEILAEHPLMDLRTITYLIPEDPDFETSAVLEIVTLPSQ